MQQEKAHFLLFDYVLVLSVVDEFLWRANDREMFIIKSCYEGLDINPPEVLISVRSALQNCWNLKAHSNVLVFGWRMILNGLPTRDQLYYISMLVRDKDKCYAFFALRKMKTTLICSNSV